jgi:hypothetical protein
MFGKNKWKREGILGGTKVGGWFETGRRTSNSASVMVLITKRL